MAKEWILSVWWNGFPTDYLAAAAGDGGGPWWWPTTATTAALLFILLCHLVWGFYSSIIAPRCRSKPPVSTSPLPLPLPLRDGEIVSDSDLKSLIDSLDDKLSVHENWEKVIDKKRENLSYTAKCCKPKDGPLKYVSKTVFDNCSTELLRDFYLDNDYRKVWDKIVISHEQLHLDTANGTEFGRTIKKFPLLTPREYILAWRLWEGKDKTYYCYVKDCEHPLAPQQKKYVRVGFFRSGWRIRKVPGKSACEIKMVHQEDAGLNVEMAKMVFANGIWSYVCKMDTALRRYAAFTLGHKALELTAVNLLQKVPPGFEIEDSLACPPAHTPTSTESDDLQDVTNGANPKKSVRRPSKKLIANGLLLLGGILCLSGTCSSLGTKVSIAYIFKKLTKHAPPSSRRRTS